MTPDKIPAPSQRLPFGAKPLPTAPMQSDPSGRHLRGTASPGLSDEAVKIVVFAEPSEHPSRAGSPPVTEFMGRKTEGKIDTTPVAERFKKN